MPVSYVLDGLSGVSSWREAGCQGWVFCFQRQLDVHGGALRQCGFQVDGSAVGVDDGLSDGQSEPDPVRVRLVSARQNRSKA